ncbi:MarR family winged helix-turn-helix transcriptional regulator [Metabacillus litoralis]|jgi:MarR family transcriptional regulator, 2-MHQ and catechol-resistance regulon repressor|uniref:MarR family winged helix-turn-helix transcriptional regulator n=1 Tax=Metabacillus litoralis TaxID=152268 RepID=UPI0020405743|nr:MarR family transcriptional regulator [Metabacillus litoralis]MCM3655157.1 MarR family transcriptional regulator [Metabacillus litoralis]
MEEICTNQAYLELMQTSKAIQDCIKIEMMNNKINITEFSVLEVLYFKGKQTIQQIGKSILISSGSMTYVIDKLEQKGLLNRIDCPNDRRVIHVVLTEDGMNFMEKVMPNHRALIDNMFGDLTDQESETMVKLLKKVSKRVEA